MSSTTEYEKGVLIIGIGKPEYGIMARNLAMSIKYNSPNVKVAMVYSKNDKDYSLECSPDIEKFCDYMIECPKQYYTTYSKESPDEPIYRYDLIKYYVYDLSPFQRTIFVDADSIAIPNKDINNLFYECNGHEFTMQNDRRSVYPFKDTKPYSCWVDVDTELDYLNDNYNLSKRYVYEYQSFFQYWEKNKSNDDYWYKLKQWGFDCPIPCTSWRGSIADEFAHQATSTILNKQPHKYIFNPVYWIKRDSDAEFSYDDIRNKFYFIAFTNRDELRDFYNHIVNYYSSHTLTYPKYMPKQAIDDSEYFIPYTPNQEDALVLNDPEIKVPYDIRYSSVEKTNSKKVSLFNVKTNNTDVYASWFNEGYDVNIVSEEDIDEIRTLYTDYIPSNIYNNDLDNIIKYLYLYHHGGLVVDNFIIPKKLTSCALTDMVFFFNSKFDINDDIYSIDNNRERKFKISTDILYSNKSAESVYWLNLIENMIDNYSIFKSESTNTGSGALTEYIKENMNNNISIVNLENLH